MSEQTPLPSALRGAVDLSSLGQTPPQAHAGGAGAPAGSAAGAGVKQGAIRVDVTDASIQEAMIGTQEVPAILVLWSASHPETEKAVTDAVAVAEKQGGRLQVLVVDIDSAPQVRAAFQVQQIPMTFAIIAAQPMPLYPGVQPVEQMERVFAEVVKVAGENGITGRVSVDGAAAQEPEEEPLSPEHQAAYDAVEAGDYAAAIAAYQAALKKNPKDEYAVGGLAQVSLMQRVQDVDPDVRGKAASNPDDVDAQLAIADLDIFGGHVEDAFGRLVDLVRRTVEDDRERVRARLVELFEVVGPQDERVVKARRALMSALF